MRHSRAPRAHKCAYASPQEHATEALPSPKPPSTCRHSWRCQRLVIPTRPFLHHCDLPHAVQLEARQCAITPFRTQRKPSCPPKGPSRCHQSQTQPQARPSKHIRMYTRQKPCCLSAADPLPKTLHPFALCPGLCTRPILCPGLCTPPNTLHLAQDFAARPGLWTPLHFAQDFAPLCTASQHHTATLMCHHSLGCT